MYVVFCVSLPRRDKKLRNFCNIKISPLVDGLYYAKLLREVWEQTRAEARRDAVRQAEWLVTRATGGIL